MTPVTRSPPRFAISIVGVAGIGVLVTTAVYSLLGFGLGLAGFGLLIASAFRGSHRGIGIGASALFAGCLVASVNGSPVGVTIGLIIGTIIVWDGAQFAWSLGAQLGTTAPSNRIVAAHMITSTVVGVLFGVSGYLMFVSVPRPVPPAAIVFLIIAVILLVIGIGSNPDPYRQ